MAPNGRQTGTILGRALVALALAVLALLPPGVMPARIGDAMTVVICTGDGPITLVTDSQGRPVAPADGTDAKAPCAFALLAATAAGRARAVRAAHRRGAGGRGSCGPRGLHRTRQPAPAPLPPAARGRPGPSSPDPVRGGPCLWRVAGLCRKPPRIPVPDPPRPVPEDAGPAAGPAADRPRAGASAPLAFRRPSAFPARDRAALCPGRPECRA